VDKVVDNVDNLPPANLFELDGAVLGLFAKQPIPGQVKTRLSPPLSPEQAAQLYQIALEESVVRLRKLPQSLAICYDGQRSWFSKTFPGLPLLPQIEGDLGARMQAASAALFATSGGPVALIGSDSPDLPLSLAQQALQALENCDVATIPCRDGGYALIALKQPQPGLFDAMPWSSEQLLDATRAQAKTLGLDYFETEPWEDLDDMPSLRRLLERSPESATAKHLRAHLSGLF